MSEVQTPAFNKRALTTLLIFFSFLLLPLSGIPLHFTRASGEPGVLEHFLMSVHNCSALIFVIAVAIHLTLNWNALTKYVASKTGEYFRFKKEVIIAFLAVIILVGVFSSHAFHAQ